jgi:hypothetical protein
MDSVPIPKNVTVYMLLKQDGIMLSAAGFGSGASASLGTGFFLTEREAEHNRTMEILKDDRYRYHIFPLMIPNPAYKE